MPKRIVNINGPDPIDIHVGKRVRKSRISLGVSQRSLGDCVGLPFQQIQKYERGANRISASKLWAISNFLNVPIDWFFEGLGMTGKGQEDVMVKEEARQLAEYYSACPASIRTCLRALFRATVDLGGKIQ